MHGLQCCLAARQHWLQKNILNATINHFLYLFHKKATKKMTKKFIALLDLLKKQNKNKDKSEVIH